MLTGLFQVCAKQKCSSVLHWFDIILMNTHIKIYGILSFYTECVLMLLCFLCFFFVNLDKQTLDTGVLRKKKYSLFLDCTLI